MAGISASGACVEEHQGPGFVLSTTANREPVRPDILPAKTEKGGCARVCEQVLGIREGVCVLHSDTNLS